MPLCWAIVGIWCILFMSPSRILSLSTRDNKETDSVEYFDVFYPQRVSDFVESPAFRHIWKRSVSDKLNRSLNPNEKLIISGFRRNFTLNLSLSKDFLGPSFLIERQGDNTTYIEEYNKGEFQCFYSGTVENEINSVATLSLCGAMRGMIQVDGEKFFIGPMKKKPSLASDNKYNIDNILNLQHIIYKFPDQNHTHTSYCHLKENFKHQRLKRYVQDFHSVSDHINSIVHSRHKRSDSLKRFVETLVVADKSMKDYHGDDLQHYVLTLMAMVTSIYKHPTIENFIDIVVVKLILLESEQVGPRVTANAATTLKEFCRWQSASNEPLDSPGHHDTAILLTRKNICRAEGKCDTLGLAELGTICDPVRSCSIIEDNGISAAYTVAHELGHVFNLPHDDDRQCNGFKRRRLGKKFHVMAPTLDFNSSPWDWSYCSAKLLTEYIDAGLAECLLDRPKVRKYVEMVDDTHLKAPGQLYTVERQCELVFGQEYTICPWYMTMGSCERLWCTNKTDSSSGCRTQHMPWADGTTCGRRMWCKSGKCVNMTQHNGPPVDGEWGDWEKYGPCSRTCGGGVKDKIRHCNNPVPSNLGKYCLGKRKKYKSCNTKPCPPSKTDFREDQCNNASKKIYINTLPANAKWVPKYSGVQMKDACKLFCRTDQGSAYYQLADKVIDGTKCQANEDDICVNGKCRASGCDNRLGSRMKRDNCGVCGGDNSSCKTIRGTFNNAIYGYNRVITIPSGATDIDIRQIGYQNSNDDDNYLSLSSVGGNYILNGGFVVRTEKFSIKVQNGVLDYSGSSAHVERINSTRMIGEVITVYVLSVGKLYPPNITYTYKISVGPNVQYKWSNGGQWRKCSRICRGTRKRKIVCIREDDGLNVSKKRCRGKPRPERIIERCNTNCKVEWRVAYQEECPVRCGTALRRQFVNCVKQTSSEVTDIDDRHCRHLGAKPNAYVECHGECLPTSWSYTLWSPCSVSCGVGKQYRQAKCVDEAGKDLPENECHIKDKKIIQVCFNPECASWQTDLYTGCTVTCGSGKRHRKVWCSKSGDVVSERLCDRMKKPTPTKECYMGECPEWFIGGWGICSVTCGKGHEERAVKCRLQDVLQEDSICDASKRPVDQQPCYRDGCQTTPSLSDVETTSSYPDQAYWRFGSWTECSSSCGTGSRDRYVSCMDYHNRKIDNERCSHLPRPASREKCFLTPCGHWSFGDWTDCTVTCGEGVRQRQVKCVLFADQMTADDQCDMSSKPLQEIHCNRGDCLKEEEFDIAVITSNRVDGTSHWRVGPWSPCSATCETGWQRRQVVCRDENGASEDCDETVRPDEIKNCKGVKCPSWQYEDWSKCSSECGKEGEQSRAVRCQLEQGQILTNSNCDITQRPADTRLCIGPCSSGSYRWHVGKWSVCSVTCGRGQRRRIVTCNDPDGNEHLTTLCPKKKPRNTKRCYRGFCPRWSATPWSQCSVTCGDGTREREVLCRDNTQNRRRILDPLLCLGKQKPAIKSTCHRKQCSDFIWKVDKWTECSKTCGFGRKEREVTCVDRHGESVTSHLCDKDNKPKVRRRCSEFPCPYIYNAEPWSECSANCGQGSQTRVVICQAVTKEGWILPGEVKNKCKPQERPLTFQYCNFGECDARYHWRVGPWGECSAKCGSGKQRRMTICVDKHNNKRSRSRCDLRYKPPSSQHCYTNPCYARSCKELKELTTIRKDGDYRILISSQLVSIYCKDMRKPTPTEYLSLQESTDGNFAEVYDMRLRRPGKCPYNGTRVEGCDKCRKKPYRQAGFTKYNKIRIDLNTLKILTQDSTFSVSESSKFIPYGSAGDCYSSHDCPQGKFNINLVDTGFIVSVNTTWILHGSKASQRIWRVREGEIIKGVCGGYCGRCSPDAAAGLQLQLRP
ncbi:hypothetical protein SNE40_014557 [Patella caerulea]|uniref:A disintegrin and metalloproteinase with thrombospondin motifs 9 n=1 Tax=Patella caerulea TaxID=87958 RepID=A0AAN8JEX5_PATCE